MKNVTNMLLMLLVIAAIIWMAPQAQSQTWNKPVSTTVGPPPIWIHWDDSTNFTTVGTGGASDFDIAARWDAAQILALDGGAVTKIAFFPCSDGAAVFRIRVWQGVNAATLLVDQAVPSVMMDQWNIIDIASPVPVDITKELWIGLNVIASGGWPAGCDAGPAVVGYGDMIHYNDVWSSLSTNYGLDYNWNIQGYIEGIPPIGIKDFSQGNVSIYSYHKNVCINVPEEVNGSVSVINLLGIEILSRKIIPGKLNKISISGPTGYYLVRVAGSSNVFTKKVFIN